MKNATILLTLLLGISIFAQNKRFKAFPITSNGVSATPISIPGPGRTPIALNFFETKMVAFLNINNSKINACSFLSFKDKELTIRIFHSIKSNSKKPIYAGAWFYNKSDIALDVSYIPQIIAQNQSEFTDVVLKFNKLPITTNYLEVMLFQGGKTIVKRHFKAAFVWKETLPDYSFITSDNLGIITKPAIMKEAVIDKKVVGAKKGKIVGAVKMKKSKKLMLEILDLYCVESGNKTIEGVGLNLTIQADNYGSKQVVAGNNELFTTLFKGNIQGGAQPFSLKNHLIANRSRYYFTYYPSEIEEDKTITLAIKLYEGSGFYPVNLGEKEQTFYLNELFSGKVVDKYTQDRAMKTWFANLSGYKNDTRIKSYEAHKNLSPYCYATAHYSVSGKANTKILIRYILKPVDEVPKNAMIGFSNIKNVSGIKKK